ncbi:response regulator [Streptomyces sp. NPDC051546]|uniref:response regulator n=1 Tax=Streptomyces sp. NPDC051546 TaxID=3365655 RepID=UPI003795A784
MAGEQERGSKALKVVVVDDEALMRSGLKMILTSTHDIDVVAVCDGPQAVETVIRTRPHVVLLDIRMPDIDGIELLTELRTLTTPPAVAMLTSFATDELVRTALHKGAAGYLMKDMEPQQLLHDVRALARGKRPLSPTVAPVVIDGYLAHTSGSASAAIDGLTAREAEVLSLVGAGLTNVEIGARLHLAPSTAKDHVSALMAKLGVDNRAQAAVLADRAGLLAQSWPGAPFGTRAC